MRLNGLERWGREGEWEGLGRKGIIQIQTVSLKSCRSELAVKSVRLSEKIHSKVVLSAPTGTKRLSRLERNRIIYYIKYNFMDKVE